MDLEEQARFIIGDEEKLLGLGDISIIPGGVVHKVIALDCLVKALDFFHPVREEYL